MAEAGAHKKTSESPHWLVKNTITQKLLPSATLVIIQ